MTGMMLRAVTKSACIWWRIGRNSSWICRFVGECVFIVSEVLAKATGMRTDHYAQDKLFGPLGIGRVDWVYSPLNIPQTGGGLRMCSRDLLKFPQLYMSAGLWSQTRIVDESWVKASTQPHAQIDDDTEYGYLW
jgi:CubicO group peptidase (beta-lactamase class C family)